MKAWLWGAAVTGCVLFLGVRLWQGNVVEASVLTLLPSAESDALLREANTVLSQRASRLLVFVADAQDPAALAEMSGWLKSELQRSPFVRQVLTDISSEQQQAFYTVYFPYRYQMLSAADRQRLQAANPLAPFFARLSAGLYGPASSVLKNLIPQDPFLLFPELAASWGRMAPPETLSSDAFAAVELSEDPFDAKSQDALMAWKNDLERGFATQWPGSRLVSTGVLPFATAERQRTQAEMTWVSVAALAGVLLLAAWVFGSLRTILLAAVPIGVGFLFACAATMWVFQKIHIITFAFGSSLIGVAIDYPLLFLSHRRLAGTSWNSRETLRRVAPGLLLGAATAFLGYAALSIAPFPGLRQMALFSSTGLAAALVTVLLWFPGWFAKADPRSDEPRLLGAGQWLLTGWRRVWQTRQRLSLMLSAALLVFILIGLAQVRFDDNIRRLQRPPEALLKDEAFIKKSAPNMGGTQFILVRGANEEELLMRQEILQERLVSLRQAGGLASVQSLAPFIPSQARQAADRKQLSESVFAHTALMRQSFQRIGLSPEVADLLLRDLRKPLEPFSLNVWLQSPVSQTLRSLWIGETPHGFAAAVLIGGIADRTAFKAAVADLAGVRFFDQGDEYSQLFRRYRQYSVGLLSAAYGAVWLLMIFRYGLRRGTAVTLPSLVATALAFACLGWRGEPLHLIHCLSALLVLAMGIDYTIYFVENARIQRSSDPTLLAVQLCALTTLISFGLLALCQTPVLAAMGSVVFLGMGFAFLLSPLPALAMERPE